MIEEKSASAADTSTSKAEDDKPRTLEDLKKAALEAENKAAKEIIAKFGVEYSQIKLDKVNEFVKKGQDL